MEYLIVFAICFVLLAEFRLFFLLRNFEKQMGVQPERKKPSPILLNPMTAHKARKAEQDIQRERDRLDTILRNIENYDGTGANQEDVPGR